jgi:phosphoribosyl 1,2-cyclic phosphate phosphodiesterase
MKITVLGCGGSGGVPTIGGGWGNCDPHNPKNIRTRSSVYIETQGVNFLIDTGPDLRQQLLRQHIKKIDAVLYTHDHSDHCHGIDDMRAVSWLADKPIDAYGDATCMQTLEQRFEYIFRVRREIQSPYKPALVPHVIDGPTDIQGVRVTPFVQNHGYMNSLGYRIGNFAYSTDCKGLDEAAFKALEGLDLWIVDASRRKEHPSHSHLEQTLAWIAQVRPKRAVLTHMYPDLDYETLISELPPHIQPGFDGLTVEI